MTRAQYNEYTLASLDLCLAEKAEIYARHGVNQPLRVGANPEMAEKPAGLDAELEKTSSRHEVRVADAKRRFNAAN